MSDLPLPILAFIAGLITFLAPCTLPLVPAFLGFIGGTSAEDQQAGFVESTARRRIFKNALFYVIGFSVVFIVLGTTVAWCGQQFFQFREWLGRIGGVVVLFFGLYLLGLFRIRSLQFLSREKKIHVLKWLKPGNTASSFILGATFAFGWSPCIGPVLAAILALTFQTATVLTGAYLLAIFSLGLAVPFLTLAFGIGHAAERVQKISRHMRVINIVSGLFLIFLGILLVSDNFEQWLAWVYRALDFINYEGLQQFL